MAKKFLPTGNLLLREATAGSMEERFSSWSKLVQQAKAASAPAVDVYCGGHWSVVRALYSSRLNNNIQPIRIWIISAGYGLISAADRIIPYSATFSPNHPDSVSNSSGISLAVSARNWWRLLGQWRPPFLAPGAPRSVAEVVSVSPSAACLLVLSPDYYSALREDLQKAVKLIADPERLIVLSSHERSMSDLPSNSIRIEPDLQSHLKGAMSSLGIRTAQAILKDLSAHSLTVSAARKCVSGLLSRHGVAKKYNRKLATDAEVIQYIEAEMSKHKVKTYSPVLRKFRDAGFACAMARFKKHFGAVQERRIASRLAQKNHEV